MELHGIKGLSSKEAKNRLAEQLAPDKDFILPSWVQSLIGIVKEPMVILLLVASGAYLSSGDWQDGLFLGVSVIVVASISFFQESRTHAALETLKSFIVNKCKVIRDGLVLELPVGELVSGDALIVEEGNLIPSDGSIIHANDFFVNESILTGESLPVGKHQEDSDLVYQGTAVVSGLAIISVTATGHNTRLQQIEKTTENIRPEKTPLEMQINHFIRLMAIIGGVIFAFVWLLNYLLSNNFKDSLLKALTLAMSILPEEIPVAFSTFMALGTWKLLKKDVLVKNLKTVETLGSASIICVDKTGTLTQNRMSLAKIWTVGSSSLKEANEVSTLDEISLIDRAMWASEPIPFDPMEKAIHQRYMETVLKDQRSDFTMLHEYPISGKPPMMTHIFANASGNQIVACKGAPEAIMAVTGLAEDQETLRVLKQMTSLGYRVLGVAEGVTSLNVFPELQQEIAFKFKGLISFYDPPKENIANVLEFFYRAGIDVKIITGDNASTASAIANQIGFRGADKAIDGTELMSLSDLELNARVESSYMFTRMFPEAKLRVINALKALGHVVAMTGDGVNDGPALKAAHIGIAMGSKGTETAKEAATLILIKDDLQGMVEAIALGRRIYGNLKKAIRYIISIHVPIILIVFVPLVLGWTYPNLFSPVHIIFLELLMGPTCSLVYENEPMEPNAMQQKPRPFTHTFFESRELIISVIQGLAIAIAALVLYQFGIRQGFTEAVIRSMVFTSIISANIGLTLINRSFYYSIIETFQYKNKLVGVIILIALLSLSLCIYLSPINHFFGFAPLNAPNLLLSLFTGLISVIWFEIVKWFQRRS